MDVICRLLIVQGSLDRTLELYSSSLFGPLLCVCPCILRSAASFL